MKRMIQLGSIICLSLTLSACSGQDSSVARPVETPVEAPVAAAQETTAEMVQTEDGILEEADTESAELDLAATDAGVDLDLTRMSSTMIYSEVYNIMTKPEDYVGKTIKMSGPYYASYWDTTDKHYHYVIIEDALGCCQEGLEFIWDEGSHAYPEEYPEEYAKIEIVGTFGMYEEEGLTYCYLGTNDVVLK